MTRAKPATATPTFGLFANGLGPTRITLTLPECPSANRWWRMVNNRMLLSREAREYKARVAQLSGARGVHCFDAGPVRVELDWYRERKIGDLDKRIGILLDSLQCVLFSNDSQVIEILARRHDDAANPRVVVTVERL